MCAHAYLRCQRPASYPDVSLKMCAQRKAGRTQLAAVCTLPMVPCGSSPVTRFALASATRKTKRLRRRLYQVAKIWNSLEPDLRKENLSKFAKSIENKSFYFHFQSCILECVFIAIFSHLNSHTVTFAVVHFSFYDKSCCCIYNRFLILKILRQFYVSTYVFRTSFLAH